MIDIIQNSKRLSGIKRTRSIDADGIAEYEKALEICERMLAFKMDPVQESNIYRKIGDNCLGIFIENNDLQSCDRAIQAYKKALVAYTRESYPYLRARTMKSLGFAYMNFSDLFDRKECLKQAISLWQEALTIFSRSIYPLDYASLQDELCIAYRKLAELEEGMANSQQAIEAGKDALNVYNSKDHPRAFARAMANLGSAYLTRAQIANRPLDRADDCRQAIASYQEALMVYKLDRFPEEFALIKNNLAIAYLALSDALEGGGGERRGEDRAIDVREGEGREVEEKEGEERVIEDEEAERREVEGGEVERGEVEGERPE